MLSSSGRESKVPIKKWPGVNAASSFGSEDIGVVGLELK